MSQLTHKITQRLARTYGPRNLWSEVVKWVTTFNRARDTIVAWSRIKDPHVLVAQVQRDRKVLDILKNMTDEALHEWLAGQFPIHAYKSARDAVQMWIGSVQLKLRVLPEPDKAEYVYESMGWTIDELVSLIGDYVTAIKPVEKAAPERFTYSKLTVHNPFRLNEDIARAMLDGLDYTIGLFKRRGVEDLFYQSVRFVDLWLGRAPSDRGPAAGHYNATKRSIAIASSVVGSTGSRLLKNWTHEVFLHELGHHLHLNVLPADAKRAWDEAWDPVDVAKKQQETEITKRFRVTVEDRLRYWDMLVATKGNLRAIRLKGADRAKFHAWLRRPYNTGMKPFVTAKQLRWTKDAEFMVRWFQDPLSIFESLGRVDGPKDEAWRQNALERRERVYRGHLGAQHVFSDPWPILDQDAIDEYRRTDPEVAKVIDDLQVPTGYARTDVMEDFAETFVAFMDNPGALSSTADFRMKRTLSLAGLYGKPIMRTSRTHRIARRLTLAASARQAANVTVEVNERATQRAIQRFGEGIAVGKFTSPIKLYRVFDGEELRVTLDTGEIKGGDYSVAGERAYGAQWGSNKAEVERLSYDRRVQAATQLDWGFANGTIWVDLDPDTVPSRRPWPPRAQDLKQIETLLKKNVGQISHPLTIASTAVNLKSGQVIEHRIRFEKNGDANLWLPDLRQGGPTAPTDRRWAYSILGSQVLISPRGQVKRLPTDRILLPSYLKAALTWLKSNAPALETHRQRGSFKGLYIRFGKWSGASKVFLDYDREDLQPGERFDRRYEAGVSVVHAQPRPTGGYNLIKPDPRQAIYHTGGNYLADLVRRYRNAPIFLVDGKRVVIDNTPIFGADGEPLLEPDSIRIVAQLDPSEVFIGDSPIS